MEPEYATTNDWYKANRPKLKIYRGQWIAYTNQGVISHDRDYDKMKSGIAPNLSSLDYVIERIFESEFVEPIRFYPVRMRTLKAHDWQPKYELIMKSQNAVKVKILVDSGAELSLITKKLGRDLGCAKAEGEINNKAEGVGGSIEYLLRQVEIQLDGHIFTAPVAWAQTDFCEEILLGREVVFDLFDIEFKQAEEAIIFKWRGGQA
ncbi:retropepsin-like aspartic protease [Planktothrix agardhii]|uniref:retropepsin-like aspartic protease n=1 Tax=Planktothrix agardhii TaxID=1160 RepID=UPI001D0AB8C9|nr:retropepsin-like aspartic protease [Planktothrix agardhii]MCB8752086.1 retropepsin-like domain-containing protein [Planktothrix agardhii 1810]MCF3608002.1 retropepsin-like domain-containing protein [Planktothrix agardhii 1033]